MKKLPFILSTVALASTIISCSSEDKNKTEEQSNTSNIEIKTRTISENEEVNTDIDENSEFLGQKDNTIIDLNYKDDIENPTENINSSESQQLFTLDEVNKLIDDVNDKYDKYLVDYEKSITNDFKAYIEELESYITDLETNYLALEKEYVAIIDAINGEFGELENIPDDNNTEKPVIDPNENTLPVPETSEPIINPPEPIQPEESEPTVDEIYNNILNSMKTENEESEKNVILE